MLQARKLIDLIEAHSDDLTAKVVALLRGHRFTVGYRRIEDLALSRRVRALYSHLGYWIRSSSDLELEDAFFALGREHCREGIPLPDVVAGQILTRRSLWEFVDEKAGDSAVELRGELDFQGLVVRFFDRALYHTVRGYEAEAKEESQAARRR